jgi:hypothetical protein
MCTKATLLNLLLLQLMHNIYTHYKTLFFLHYNVQQLALHVSVSIKIIIRELVNCVSLSY